eukprot:scaffold277596_cov33-Tisochrysis_lutea.AAC.6
MRAERGGDREVREAEGGTSLSLAPAGRALATTTSLSTRTFFSLLSLNLDLPFPPLRLELIAS